MLNIDTDMKKADNKLKQRLYRYNLANYIKRHFTTHTNFAKHINMHKQVLSEIVNGYRIAFPSDIATIIEPFKEFYPDKTSEQLAYNLFPECPSCGRK